MGHDPSREEDEEDGGGGDMQERKAVGSCVWFGYGVASGVYASRPG